MSQSKWRYKNPIDSRLLQYTSTLRVLLQPLLAPSLKFQQTQCSYIPQTIHQIDSKVVNTSIKDFSNIRDITSPTILTTRKLPDRIIEPTSTNATKKSTNTNQKRSTSRRSSNQNKWETQRSPNFRTQFT